MSLDDIDREAMREGRAILKLRDFTGLRNRAKKEKKVQLSNVEQVRRAWDSIAVKK